MKRKIILPEYIEEFYGPRLPDIVWVVAYTGDLLKIYFSDRSIEYWEGNKHLKNIEKSIIPS